MTDQWECYYWSRSREHAYQLLVECLLFRDRDGQPRGLRIVGPPRTGKSSFLRNAIKRLQREYPQLADGLLLIQPPGESMDGIGGYYYNMLVAIGHPAAAVKLSRVESISLGTPVVGRSTGVVIDEAHLMAEEKTGHFLNQSVRWIRLIMNSKRLPFILAGTNNLATVIRTSNELGERMRALAELVPFSIADDEGEAEYLGYLGVWEATCPLGFFPSLVSPEMVIRMYCADGGIAGHSADIINRAFNRAQLAGERIIGMENLAAAFATEFSERAAVLNPFVEDNMERILKAISARERSLAKEQADIERTLRRGKTGLR